MLDVGYGHGAIFLDVAQAVHPGKLVGIDIMEETVALAAGLAKERGIENVQFIVMDAHKLDFGDNTFDLIFSYTTTRVLLPPPHHHQRTRIT